MPDAPPRFRPENATQRTIRRLVAFLVALLAANGGTAASEVESPAADARFLVVVLDAVPYASAVAFTRPGDETPTLLATLDGPVPLVSSFPSSTSVALTAILSRFGLEIPPGYENKFFDHDENRVRGGTLGSYGKIRFDWHHFFDWQLRGFFSKSKAYAKPLKYNVREIDRAFEAFEQNDDRSFFIYVNSTDATGHAHGPDALRATFEHLDAALGDLRQRSERPIHLVLLSDHGLGGGEPLANAYGGVRRALKDAGYRLRKRLDRDDAVVLTPFGLVSSFEIYTHPGDEVRVTGIVVREPGVDLCAYREDDGWIVVDRDGRAVIDRREGPSGSSWAYRIEDADPLEYADVVHRLTVRSRRGEFFSEQEWFRDTHEETYPDGLFRLASAFELVQNPASVVCSVARGHLFGSKSAVFGAKFSVGRLHWTHGGLGRDETLGFLMTDVPGWAADGPVRFDNALDFLAEALDPKPKQHASE